MTIIYDLSMEDEARRVMIIHRVIERMDARIKRLIEIRNRLQCIADTMEKRSDGSSCKND